MVDQKLPNPTTNYTTARAPIVRTLRRVCAAVATSCVQQAHERSPFVLLSFHSFHLQTRLRLRWGLVEDRDALRPTAMGVFRAVDGHVLAAIAGPGRPPPWIGAASPAAARRRRRRAGEHRRRSRCGTRRRPRRTVTMAGGGMSARQSSATSSSTPCAPRRCRE